MLVLGDWTSSAAIPCNPGTSEEQPSLACDLLTVVPIPSALRSMRYAANGFWPCEDFNMYSADWEDDKTIAYNFTTLFIQVIINNLCTWDFHRESMELESVYFNTCYENHWGTTGTEVSVWQRRDIAVTQLIIISILLEIFRQGIHLVANWVD